MAKRIIWTKRAQQERKEILEFWKEHNKSKSYSKKLDHLFKKAIKLITTRPGIGRSTDIENVRIKVVRDYLIFYELINANIYILTILDSRQDPKKLKM